MAYAALWMSRQGKQSQPEHHEPRPSVFYTAAVSCHGQSQPSQATPKPAAQASAATPAQFEKSGSGSRMAAKPLAVGTSTAGGATAGRGGGSVLTAGKVTPKATAEASSVSQVRAPAEAPPPAAAAAAAAAAAGTTASSAVNVPKDAAKSAAAVPQQASASKIDPAKAAKPSAAAGKVSVQGKTDAPKPTQTKVQVEVPAAASRGTSQAPALDPFDALADSLPSAAPVAPQPAYTGAEVKELSVTAEKGQKCGERDATLPPGYRFEDMPRVPADVKPKDTPKPLSTDEALDSLSAGFMTSTSPAKPEKKDNVGSVTASSAAPANFAPPPAKKPESPAVVPPVAVCPAPPAMKKASAGFSLQAGLSPSASKEAGAVCPPADKKAKLEEAAGKPSTAGRSAVPTDALSALGSLLPTSAPKPELPEVRPKDIVTEDKHKKEKGVLVGEDENTIPPEYRFDKDALMKLPAPKPEPTLGPGEALDFLSGDFLTSSTAPAVQAPVASASVAQQKVESSLVPPVAVCRAPPPVQAKADQPDSKPKPSGPDPTSLDVLSSMLPTDAPKPRLPEVRVEDIVSEDKHKKEKGVLVGEDENTIPPEYRLSKEELMKLPAPKPEPTLDTVEALDILSGDLLSSSTAPVAQAPVVTPSNSQIKVEDLSAVDVLSGDLMSSTKAAKVQAPLPPAAKKTPEKAVCPPPQPLHAGLVPGESRQGGSMSLDALNALGGMLPTDAPKPELPELRPEDIVSEEKQKKEKGVLVGEDENTIPPEYRFNEEDLRKLPAPKPEPPIDTGGALDFLSGDLMTSSTAAAVQAPVVSASAPPPAQSSADAALDALAGEFVSSSSAPAVKSACGPAQTTPSPAGGADSAMDALSATLMDIAPTPHPEPVFPTKDVVKEKTIVEERLIKMGERDDTLPPEHQPTEEDLKKMAEFKEQAATKPKEKTLDDKTALDFLSSGFETKPASIPTDAATAKLEPPVPDSNPLKPMAGPVLESLADSLVPAAMEAKTQTDKAKGKSKSKSRSKKPQPEEPPTAVLQSASLRSDVVPTTQAGKR
ncbi:calpastatin isoform X6 [Nelusetta ayraudi]|uniref:calpastatin isoform X6 n=1 Tax=Nelusetta ayraudi TaxID=303726 RepID=UPI003F6ECB8B